MQIHYFTGDFSSIERALWDGDAVKAFFFVKDKQIILLEDSYFFLMASMRKLRMSIPLYYTTEFFRHLFYDKILEKGFLEGIIHFLVYRKPREHSLHKGELSYSFRAVPLDLFKIQGNYTVDIIKEIYLSTHLLDNIRVHSAENIYAKIYAQENDLDEVILLNSHKRIARCISGNLLFLTGKKLHLPKTSEGAYISPLMESFVTFVHRSDLATLSPAEMSAFESQTAEEILIISDEKGIYSINKIRNKNFNNTKFSSWISMWKEDLLLKQIGKIQ
ncbi:MAG: aminodeoxychorismate lyase [Bergeyella sp.]|nr:aminodeoxychorismate lyase [Bergeyella sp.]